MGASGPPSGILFEKGLGEQLIFGRPLDRLWALGAPKSFRNAFRSDFFGSHFGPKVGKEASKRHPKIDTVKTKKKHAKRLPK